MIDVIHQIFSLIFGLAMVFGLLIFIYKRDAVDWEKLEAAYCRAWLPPGPKRNSPPSSCIVMAAWQNLLKAC